MKLLAKTKINHNDLYYNKLPLPTQVNLLGKYLEKHLEGVDREKSHKAPNEYIIYDTILYIINDEVRRKISDHIEQLKKLYGKYEMPAEVQAEISKSEQNLQEIKDTVYEMDLYLNITTYGQYIRVNVIQLDEYEKTLGYMRLEPKDLVSLPFCQDKLVKYVKHVVETKYKDEGYEVLI